MDYNRIRSTLDVARMMQIHATIVGGAFQIAEDLVRCGCGSLTLIDFDSVDGSNPARQDFDSAEIGQLKVEATAERIRRINPATEVTALARDVCTLSEEEVEQHIGSADLVICATDSFAAQAWGNREATRLGVPCLSIGIYRFGRAGEIVYWVPGVTPACYRCICSARYEAIAAGPVVVTSEGGTILDLHLVDAIAGQIAVGILTRGADNRMGRLVDQLGNRNFLQVKIDPDYRLGEADIFRHYLGDHPANFSFTTIALPQDPDPECPDCMQRLEAQQEVA